MLSNHYAKRRLSKIDKRLSELGFIMRKLPPGRLHCSNSRGKTYFYQVSGSRNGDDFSRTYLTKDKKDIVVALAKKELCKAEQADLLTEKASLEAMLEYQKHAPANQALCRIRKGNKKILELIGESNVEDLDARAWANAEYSSSAPFPEQRRIRAIDGRMVRSKSEAEIISLLVKYEIPYRYECDLIVNGHVVACPDFTIMHPVTHEIYIWEHLGLLDNSEYFAKSINKFKKYSACGFYPMINLIITGETAEKPFDVTLGEDLVQHFFLM